MCNVIKAGPNVYQSPGVPVWDYNFKKQLPKCIVHKSCSENLKQNSSKIPVIVLIFYKVAGLILGTFVS